MIKVIRGEQRHLRQNKRLRGYCSFSFQDYYDEEQDGFGSLVVLNEEWIRPGKGFAEHPNYDMQIITYIQSGKLCHSDSLSDSVTFAEPGQFQYLCAGKEGVLHSEKNASQEEDLHYLQFWLAAGEQAASRFEIVSPKAQEMQNQLCLLFSNQANAKVPTPIVMDFYQSCLQAQRTLRAVPAKGQISFLWVIEGEIEALGERLQSTDSLQVRDDRSFSITAKTPANFFLLHL